MGLAHKNSKDYKGPFVLYQITDTKTNQILKVGKADATDVMPSNNQYRRAHTSERLAKKTYPNAKVKIIEDLGIVTTAEAEAREAEIVKKLKKDGHELPLNKEKRKEYNIDDNCGV